MRSSGVLLPIASLPSKYGIGCFSKEAYEFVDFLADAHQAYWQVLPMGPTGYGDSPYQSFSTFAGNPYFISLEELIELGWLSEKECDSAKFGNDKNYIDYAQIYVTRFKLLRKAFEKSNIENCEAFIDFSKENAYWLDNYSLYMAMKNAYKGKSFLKWKTDDRLKKTKAVSAFLQNQKNIKEILFWKFLQYEFFAQWMRLKKYANDKGVKIIGDIPIYVALDSADTWANPELFQFDKKGEPLGVAGCPPDYFSETGQLWGNPLYDWEYHKKHEYSWWMARLKKCFELYDVVRIDHFRGFDEYYFIPYGDKTAEHGHWEKGPGYELFDTLKKKIGKKAIIAEDLGYLTDSVRKLVKKCGYPGMKILEFAFDSGVDNDYLPHNYAPNCIVYTGTHDNDTVKGWFDTLKKKEKDYTKKYIGIKSNKDIVNAMIRLAQSSVADTCIIPFQDYLELGTEARINIPSTLGNNWKWRMNKDACTKELAEKIYALTKMYGRC